MKANKVIILGNSITRHGPKADIGWLDDWGMAASALEKDYVHLLLKRFTEAACGKAPESLVKNIADFEREYATYDVSAVFKPLAAFEADIIIMAIGENVPALDTEKAKINFHRALTMLLTTLKQGCNPTVFVRSSFWPDAAKDGIMKQVCAETGSVFVDISRLGAEESNYARSERTFTNTAVANHPGDKGMRKIADAIWNAVEGKTAI